jgi:Xaa-Pro dipeptidase
MADCHFVYDIKTDHSILFIPPVVDEEVIWSGIPTTIEDALKKYDVDEVRHTTQVNSTLIELAGANPGATVYTIETQSSGKTDLSKFSRHDAHSAKSAIETCRVVKDDYEIATIRKANNITCRGIEAVMARAKSAETESELEAAFRERCISHGSKETAYPPIIAAGSGAATLHYVDNLQPLKDKLNLLIDAGCEWNNYASDIVSNVVVVPKSLYLQSDNRLERSLLRGNSQKSLAASMTLCTR